MGVYQCLLGIARDFGPSPDNVKAAVNAVLKAAATVKRGMREKDGQSGAQDVVDKELHHHLKDKGGLLQLLITGEASLARMLEDSGKYRILWAESQQKEFSQALRNFSYAKQRFNSLSMPLFKLLSSLKSVYAFLVQLAAEGDRDDRRFAETLLTELSGRSAFQHLVNAALAADSMLIGQRFLRLADTDNDEACVTAQQAAETIHTMEHMFDKGGVFLPSAAATVTQTVIRTLQDIGIITFLGNRTTGSRGPRPLRAVAVWDVSEGDLTESRQVAQKVYRIYKAFFDSNFPRHEYSNAFAAMDLENDLTLSQRGELVQSIAQQNHMDGAKTWKQLSGGGSDDGLGAGGLLARAFWHLKEQRQGSNNAWLATLRELRKEQAAVRLEACWLVQHTLTIGTSTASVERNLHEVSVTELKNRAHRLHIYALQDAVKLSVHGCASADSLRDGRDASGNWKPSKFA
ncbi:unnamed protein product, partial [Symbiodinium sp. CCMP2592]